MGGYDVSNWYEEISYNLDCQVTDDEVMQAGTLDCTFYGGPLDGLTSALVDCMIFSSSEVIVRPTTHNCTLDAEFGTGNRVELSRHIYEVDGVTLKYKGVAVERINH